MHSPGKYYERVPKEPGENLRFRKYVLDRCRQNPRYRAAVLEMCRDDLLFYINSFVWQFNPKRVGAEVEPFITWPFQDNAFRVILDHVVQQRDLVMEKSREMGATWICLITEDWIGKFHDHKTMGVISRDADAVDDGTMNSLLPKLDFIADHQPHWLAGEIEKKTKGMLRRYLRTKSVITGEASTGKAFVGGRALMIFVDEFSQITEGYKVQQRTHDVSACRIFNFTHVGATGHAYELSQRVDVDKLVMHWSDHPRKNPGLYRYDPEQSRIVALDKSYHFPADYPFVMDGTPGGPFAGIRSPWYDAECRRRASSRAVAEDLDIDPAGSTRQFFDQLKVMDCKRQFATDPFWSGTLLNGRLAKTFSGLLKLWLQPDAEGKPPKAKYCIGCDVSGGTGATNSTMTIANMNTGEKVGEYADPTIKPDHFGEFAVEAARLFADEDGDGATLCWEIQGAVGETFGQAVTKAEYSRLFYPIHHITKDRATRPGWSNTGNTLQILLRSYEAALYSGYFINRSAIALDECLKFQFTTTGKVEHTGFAKGERDDPSGARENHGDRVVADALAWLMMQDQVRIKSVQTEEEQHPFGSYGWRQSLRTNTGELNWLDRKRRSSRDQTLTVWNGAKHG